MVIEKVRKRDGRIVDFNPDKISNAIFKAAQSVGGHDRALADKLAMEVNSMLEQRYSGTIPSVENVQDLVEKVLIENGHAKTAKAYILYRQEHKALRDVKEHLIGVQDDLKLTINAVKVLERRYLMKDLSGHVVETPKDMFRRVAHHIAKADLLYNEDSETSEDEFYKLMTTFEFLPGSPAFTGAGTDLGQLSSCFVLPIDDNMESIFGTLRDMAMVHKSGGGTGFSFSRIRPRSDIVKSTRGVASGPVSFMKAYNMVTEVVKQGGTRRGANMAILRVDHPDILDFIMCKEHEGHMNNFNISVGMTEDFMRAVESKGEYELKNPRTGELVKTLSARSIFDLIITMAWKNGEPGIVFLDRINKDNPTPHIGDIESTNPCIAGGTLVSTEHGLMRMDELCEKYPDGGIGITTDNRVQQYNITMSGGALLRNELESGTEINHISRAWRSGRKKCLKLTTKCGFELTATPDHKVLTNQGWVEMKDLKPGIHKVLLQSGKGKFNSDPRLPFFVQKTFTGRNGKTYKHNFPEVWSKELGQILGWLAGDGWLIDKGKNCRAGFTFGNDDIEVLNHLKPIINSMYGKNISEIRRENGVIHLSYHGKYFVEFFKKIGMMPEKNVPKSIFTAPEDAVVGFLQGLFSSDGTVRDNPKSNSSWIALTSKNKQLLKEVQLLLINLGIKSLIYDRSRQPRSNLFRYEDKNGRIKFYESDGVLYELCIFGESRDLFRRKIGFINSYKQKRLEDVRYKIFRKTEFMDDVISVSEAGEADVFDLTEPNTHSMVCHSLVVHQCGEQPLLPYESCNLGSINLAKVVKDSDGRKTIDYEKLRKITKSAMHFLDNVVDMNVYPIPQIEEMTKANRKVGLGVMGFADMLLQLGVPYNSNEATTLAEDIMSFIQEEARNESVELGKRRGSFPNFENSLWDKAGYSHMRNATCTTIAPTGTISIIAGCSSGIEPLFAICYVRNVMDNTELLEINPYFERMARERGFYSEELMMKIAQTGHVHGILEIPADVRRIFVTAHQVSPEWHTRMQAAFQKYTDNAVSKTVNFPQEATPEDIEKVYYLAYKLGCKGVTVYRDKSRSEQVLNLGSPVKKTEPVQATDAPSDEPEEGAQASGALVVHSEFAGGCTTCSL